MKKLLIAAAIGMFMTAAAGTAMAKDKYGKKFSTAKAVDVKSFTTAMSDKKEMNNVVVEGTISQVCQAAGCWVKLKNEDGEDILVKFKDHAFLIPKNTTGKAFVSGNATRKVISVEERKHMAEDAGASEGEIAAITTPKEELRIDASGIVVE